MIDMNAITTLFYNVCPLLPKTSFEVSYAMIPESSKVLVGVVQCLLRCGVFRRAFPQEVVHSLSRRV